MLLAGTLSGAEEEVKPEDTTSDTLTGGWSVRKKLEEHGVLPFGILTAEVWGNASGGQKTGAWYNQLLDFGLKLDTEKLNWWKGGLFCAQMHWAEHTGNDSCFADYTGAFNPISSIMAGDHFRVFNLYYQHCLPDDVVLVKAGQIAVDDDFMRSDFACLFVNSAFGAMASQVGTPLAIACGNSPAFPIYSVAAPGAFVKVQPWKTLYSQLGLYYGRPGFDEESNHGFGWLNESPPELGLFWETGYRYKVAAMPAAFKFGLSFHTGPRDDFTNPGVTEGLTRQSVPNYYVIQDLQLLSDSNGNPKLGLFGRCGVTPDPNLSMISLYADAGINWVGPLPNRPDDAVGMAVSYTRFGSAFQASTGPDGVASSEPTIELTYRAKVTSWMALQADAQFLFNPAVNPDSGSRQTSVVIGLRAEIDF